MRHSGRGGVPFRYNGLGRPLECAPAPRRRLLVAQDVVQGWIDGVDGLATLVGVVQLKTPWCSACSEGSGSHGSNLRRRGERRRLVLLRPRALQPAMRALPHGGNRRRLAHGARRLVAGKSATSATRARRETQWSAPRGKHLFFSLQVCRLPPPAPLARRWAPAPSPRGCTPPSAPPRPVSRAEAPPGTPYRPPKQHIPFC